MDMEFRVYRRGEVIFRAPFALPEDLAADEVNRWHIEAVQAFRKANPDIQFPGDGLEIRWAKPGDPDGILLRD